MKDLKTANRLIEKIAKEYKEITPITLKDISLFEKFFEKEPHTYGNSWTYITQGMYGIGPQGLGYKYYDGKNLAAVCVYPKVEQPNTYCFYWIRPMGNQILDIIEKYSKKLLKTYSTPTYVKKIFKDRFEYLKKREFKDILTFPWHTHFPSEDDTFPEQVYDVQYTTSLLQSPPRTSNIRKSYRKAICIEKNNKVVMDNYNFKKDAWQITNNFFNSSYIKHKKINVSSPDDYYNSIFKNPQRNNLIHNVFYVNNEPVGFYIGENQGSDTTAIYALITLRDKIEYLSDYVFFKLIEKCQTRYLNLGGSEDEGIHKFKLKFKPVYELKMYWVSYN